MDEIVFSQLLSFITNLNDFEIDKRVILKIADEFIQKYKYLSESNIESVYQIISKEKDDLEKLRKEYDASLESEIIEIKDEKSVVKKDVKEEKKEEQKEEKKEEEKKEEKKEEQKMEEKNKNYIILYENMHGNKNKKINNEEIIESSKRLYKDYEKRRKNKKENAIKKLNDIKNMSAISLVEKKIKCYY